MEKNKIQTTLLSAAILALGMVLLGWVLRSGIVHFKESERVVTVKGLSEQEVKADRVIWPLTYKVIGNDLPELYNNIEKNNATIISFLKENGIDEKEITVAPSQLVDLKAERYGNYNSTPYRYNITTVLTVATGNVDLVRKLMQRQGDLLKQGVAIGGEDYQYRTEFLYTGLNNIKPKMIEEATANARTTAEKFAHDSKSKLGKIRTAYQGQFSISDRDANTPYIKTVRVVTTVEYYLKD